MPRIDIDNLPVRTGSSYPAPHDQEVVGRSQIKLGDPAGLTQFGVNLVRLEPGAKSSLMHWHERQDEFLVVTDGALTLVEQSGETPLRPGDCCAFPAGVPNGHHIINRSDAPGSFVVVGTRTDTETGWYPGLDLKVDVSGGQMRFVRLDGSDASAPDGPAWDVFERISTQITHALITGDYGRYRALIHLPLTLSSAEETLFTLTDDSDLREDFHIYHEMLKQQGVTDIHRRITHIEEDGPEARNVACSVTLIGPAGPVVETFRTVFRCERQEAVWKLSAVDSSKGHIFWSRGRARISPDATFELD